MSHKDNRDADFIEATVQWVGITTTSIKGKWWIVDFIVYLLGGEDVFPENLTLTQHSIDWGLTHIKLPE